MTLSSRGTQPFGPVSFDQPKGPPPPEGRGVSQQMRRHGVHPCPLITCLPYNLLILLSHSGALLDFVCERSQNISRSRLQQILL